MEFAREAHFHRNIHLMEYSRFGPQAMSYELLGFEWYQWRCCGAPDPSYEYDVTVVVYRDMDLEEVQSLYPVSEVLAEDYRYLEYGEAVRYLDREIAELEGSMNDESDPDPNGWRVRLLRDLRETRSELVTRLGR